MSTFYRHYKNKDALLLDCCKRLAEQLAAEMTRDDSQSIYKTALKFFSFWEKNQNFITLLRKNDLLYFFLKSYDDLMFHVSRIDKEEIDLPISRRF